MESRASHLTVGAITLLLICSVPALLLWFSAPNGQNLVDHYVRFQDSVAGVRVGSSVLFGGIPIGHVTAVRIDPTDSSLARVDIAVDAAAPIYSDSKATLRLEGISGNFLVDISRGGRMRSEKLGPGTEIASRYSPIHRMFLGFSEMVNKGGLLMAQVDAFFNAHNVSMVDQILANIAKLRLQLAAKGPAIDNLRAQGVTAIAQFNQTWIEFQQTGTEIERLSSVAAAAKDQLQKLASALRGPLANFGAFVEENRPGVENFWNNGFSQWPPMLAEIHRVGANVSRLLTEIKQDPARFFFSDPESQGYVPPPPSTSEHH